MNLQVQIVDEIIGNHRIEFDDFVGNKCVIQENVRNIMNPKLHISVLQSTDDSNVIILDAKGLLAILPFLVSFAKNQELISTADLEKMIRELAE